MLDLYYNDSHSFLIMIAYGLIVKDIMTEIEWFNAFLCMGKTENEINDSNNALLLERYMVLLQSMLTVTQTKDTPTFHWVTGDYYL